MVYIPISKITRFTAGTVLAVALLFGVGAIPAQAAALTSDQINAIIRLLQSFGADSATIANVNTALGGGSSGGGNKSCHTFNIDLKIGDGGSLTEEIRSLQTLLQKEGMQIDMDEQVAGVNFGESTAAAAVQFQAKYGIRRTGYVGPLTRAQLNKLYGCAVVVPPNAVGHFEISPASVGTLKVGDSLTFKALYYPPMPPCSGDLCAQVMPAPQPVEVRWSVGSANVLRVTSSSPNSIFTATAVRVGKTYIDASYESPTTDKTFRASVTVVVQGETAPLSITVLSPNGGEIYAPGSSQRVTWTSSGIPSTNSVTLRLRGNDDGLEYPLYSAEEKEIVLDATPNDGTQLVLMPSNLPSQGYRLEVKTSYGDQSYMDASDSYFKIYSLTTQPSITILSPSNGTFWRRGTLGQWTWSSPENVSSVDIYLIGDQISFGTNSLAKNYPNYGSFGWTVGAAYSAWTQKVLNGTYKIAVCPSGQNIGSQCGSFVINIYDDTPTVTLFSPTGGEVFQTNGTIGVSFSHSSPGEQYKINLLFPAKGSSIEYNLGTVSGGASGTTEKQSFTIPANLSAGTYTIQVIQLGNQGTCVNACAMVESAPFTITTSPPLPAPSFKVVTPTTSWTAGSTQTIQWSSANYPSTAWVRLELLQDTSTGAPLQPTPYLSVIVPNYSGSYQWSIPPTSVAQAPNYHLSVTCDEFGAQAYPGCGRGMSGNFGIVDVAFYPIASFSLTADKTSVSAGGSLTVQWSNTAASTYVKDWIALVPAGTTNWPGSLPWFYTNGASSGSQTMQVPSTPGTYDLAYYQNNSVTVWKRGSQVQVTGSGLGSANSVNQTASALDGLNNAANAARTDPGYFWSRDLGIDSPYASDVAALQKVLTSEGLYTGPVTGGFYTQTYAAVGKFQEKYGIESTGFVGPATRTKLNTLYYY